MVPGLVSIGRRFRGGSTDDGLAYDWDNSGRGCCKKILYDRMIWYTTTKMIKVGKQKFI